VEDTLLVDSHIGGVSWKRAVGGWGSCSLGDNVFRWLSLWGRGESPGGLRFLLTKVSVFVELVDTHTRSSQSEIWKNKTKPGTTTKEYTNTNMVKDHHTRGWFTMKGGKKCVVIWNKI